MSEHKLTCGDCGREPGGIHLDSCPRSRATRSLLDAHSRRRGNRFICPPKNVPMHRDGDGASEYVVNPGIPYVRAIARGKKPAKPAKPWYAGGIPARIRNNPVVKEVLAGRRPIADLLSGRL